MRVEKGTRVCGSWTLIMHVVIGYWNIYNEHKTTDLILYRANNVQKDMPLYCGFKGRVQGLQIHMYVINVSGKSPAVGGACAVKYEAIF